MTKLALSTRFGFAAIVLAALPSVAGAVRPKVPVQTPAERDAAMLRKYDLNHNGQLDAFERRRMAMAQKESMLDKFDANGNGKLNTAETAEARRYRVARLISILDTNRDGLISYREAHVRSDTDVFAKFRSIDLNHDWRLSKRELLAAPYIQTPVVVHRRPWWIWWAPA